MPEAADHLEHADIHRTFAINLFNHVWDLMERSDRSACEDARMLNEAHASRYHWGEVGTEVQIGRGEWQISRANALLKQGAAALLHAQLYLESCSCAGMADWDLPFAHEALARAYAALGDRDQFSYHHRLASELGGQIAEEHDRRWLQECLVTEPWFGMLDENQAPLFLRASPIGDTDIMKLPVKTLGPALGYYTAVLGFAITRQTKTNAFLRRGGAEIGLEVNSLDPEQASCYFAVTNIESLHKEFLDAKIAPSELAVQVHNGSRYRVFFAQDPYGVCFCFGEAVAQ